MSLEQYVRRVVAGLPPITPEGRDALAGILAEARRERAA